MWRNFVALRRTFLSTCQVFRCSHANLSAVPFRDITVGKYRLPAVLTAQGPSRQASASSGSLVGRQLMRKLPQRSLAVSFQRRLERVPKDTCGVGNRARTSSFDAGRMEEGRVRYGGAWNGTRDETERREAQGAQRALQFSVQAAGRRETMTTTLRAVGKLGF